MSIQRANVHVNDSFGPENVTEKERNERVQQLFSEMAPMYDRSLDISTLGIHRIWKEILIRRLAPTKYTKLIDVAGGTGDIAFRFLNYIKRNNIAEGCHVTVVDKTPNMLEVGKNRNEAHYYDPALISWKLGDAEELPFEENSFTAYSISFGVRNCTRVDKVFKEAYRVLQPGGKFICMELYYPESRIFRWFYKLAFSILSLIWPLCWPKWDHHVYLVESIKTFPNQDILKTMIEEAGFQQVTYENLLFGVAAIHMGYKL